MKPKNTPSLGKLTPNQRVRDTVKTSPKTSFGDALAKKSAELRTADEEKDILEAVGVELLKGVKDQPKAAPLSEEKSDDDGGEGW